MFFRKDHQKAVEQIIDPDYKTKTSFRGPHKNLRNVIYYCGKTVR